MYSASLKIRFEIVHIFCYFAEKFEENVNEKRSRIRYNNRNFRSVEDGYLYQYTFPIKECNF